MGARKVAQVNGPGTIFGKLVSGSAANAEGTVGACFGCVRGGLNNETTVFSRRPAAGWPVSGRPPENRTGQDNRARRQWGSKQRERRGGIPVIITTFPVALGPLEGPATFLSLGIPSKVPWLGMGATSCSLSADRRRLATEAADARSGLDMMTIRALPRS